MFVFFHRRKRRVDNMKNYTPNGVVDDKVVATTIKSPIINTEECKYLKKP